MTSFQKKIYKKKEKNSNKDGGIECISYEKGTYSKSGSEICEKFPPMKHILMLKLLHASLVLQENIHLNFFLLNVIFAPKELI